MAEHSVEAPASRRRPHSPFSVLVFLLALGVGVLAALSGLGSRWGWWHFGTGFSLLRWAAYAAIAVGLLSLVALFVTRPGAPRGGFALALLAFIVCLVTLAIPLGRMRAARSAPPIHDISTDVGDPPRFVAVVPLRANDPNPVEYEGPEVAAQQRAAYPDIRPLVLDFPVDSAYDLALAAARDMGWEIVAAEPTSHRIEATDQTFWFGFKDDVVIRLTPMGQRTVVDVRSLSRVGKGDLGTNADRVRSYLHKLRESLE